MSTRPKRIAVVNDLHSTGGAVGVLALRYVRALKEAGHDASLITGVGDEKLPKDLPAFGWDYPERKESMGLWDSRKFQGELTRRVKASFEEWSEGGADAWIALVPPSAHAILTTKLGRDLPFLYVCNSPWGREYFAACVESSGGDLSIMQRLGVNARRKVERRVIHYANCLISLSNTQRDWMEKEHPHEIRQRYEIIPGAVDEAFWQPVPEKAALKARRKHAGRGEYTLLVCSRRLVYRCGVDMLVEAMLELPDSVRLVITGDGPQRESLKNTIITKGLKKRVFLSGMLSREDLRALTCAADFAVIPTRALEGFGLSAAEAMCCGTPVIATPVDALEDVVGCLDRNLLCEAASPEALREGIASVLTVTKYRDPAWKKKCRLHALDRYAWGTWKSAFVQLCEEVAEGSS